MDERQKLNGILGALQSGLELDSEGQCELETEDGGECLLSLLEISGEVVISTPIIDLPLGASPILLEEALVVNDDLTLTGPSRLSYSREHECLVLRHVADLDTLNSQGLEALIGAILDLAVPIRAHLQPFLEASASPAESADNQSGDGLPSSAIRV